MGNLRIVALVVVLGVFILGAVFSSSLVGCKKGDDIMGVTNGGVASDKGIPTIDASAPEKTETATFALG